MKWISVLVAVLWVAPSVARGEAAVATSYLAKKDTRLAEKMTQPRRPVTRRAIGSPPPKVISLYNTWTREVLPMVVKGKGKTAVDPEIAARFLRCHFTNEARQMQSALVPIVVAAARHFAATRVDVVSGFRHPKYNLMLRKKGRAVARDSQHTQGNAIDFRLPGVPTHRLHKWALGRGLGGVGLYLDSGFIHIDSGPPRRWSSQ